MFELAVLAFYAFALFSLSIVIASRYQSAPHVHGKTQPAGNLRGKTVIVTGGNSGLGFNAAEQLAARGARVVLACRDLDKARGAQRRIVEATSNPNVIIKRLNLASLSSVRAFCAELLRSEERVDVLINNAGAINLGNHTTEDDLQITWQTNYFGPFLLTNLLLDKLKSSKGKVINVTGQFCATRARLNDLNTYAPQIWNVAKGPNLIADIVAYFNAKSALYESTLELAQRLGNCGSTACVFSVNPNSSNFYRRIYLGPIAVVYFWLHTLFPKPEKEAEKLVELILRDAFIPPEDTDCLSSELWRRSSHLVNLNIT